MIGSRVDSPMFRELTRELVSGGHGFRFQARGRSMTPTIQDGDILHVQPTGPGKLRTGDIVLFKSGREFKAHRILKQQNGVLITRGDAGMQADQPIPREQILGKVTAKECCETSRIVRLGSTRARLQFLAREASRLARRTPGSIAGTLTRGLLLWVVVIAPALLHAQLSIDHSSTVVQNSITGAAGSYTLAGVPLTVTSPANLLVVGVSFNNSSNPGSKVTGITWGAQAFTGSHSFSFVNDPGNGNRVEIWYLEFPTAATDNVVVTINKTGGSGAELGVQVGAIDFFGADNNTQTSPVRASASASGTSSTASVTVASAGPEIVLDTLATPATVTATVVAPQTQQWNATSTGTDPAQNVVGLGSTNSGASPNVTMSETLSASATWADLAISIKPPEADLSITKSGPATVLTGATFSYTLMVKNNGPRPTTIALASDALPSQVTYVSAASSQGSCSQNNGIVSCSLGVIANGNTATVTITVTAGPPARAINSATVTGSPIDPDLSNNSDNLTTDIEFPTAANINSFSAIGTPGGVVLSWNSAGELRNLGYNVYRDSGGEKAKLNSALIAGSALLLRGALEQHGARTYKWIDSAPNSAGLYWLEDIDLNGTRTLHGPVSVQQSTSLSPVPPNSITLRDETTTPQPAATRNMWGRGLSPARRAGKEAAQPSASDGRSHVREAIAHPFANSGANGLQLAAMPAVKIFIDHEGWYRISQSQLVAVGFNPGVEAGSLHLYAEGVEQPIRITGSDGRFGPQSAIEFYGTAIDTPYSGQRVYWLAASNQPGLRVPDVVGGSSGPQPDSFMQTVELKPRTTYFAALLRENTDNFFGPMVSPTPETETLTVSNLAAGEGRLEIALQGVTQGQPHDVTVMLNGSTLGDITFADQGQGHAEFPVSAGVLTNGANTITLTAQQGDTDLSLVDTIDLSFPHTFTAESDFLKFTAEAGESVTITGFVQPPNRVIDVTNPLQPLELQHSVTAQSGTYSLQASIPWTTPGQHTLLALSDAQLAAPAALSLHRPSNLHGSQSGASIVIVTAPQFANQLAPLALLHRSEGQSVVLVSADSIYDEFNFGERTPFAIRNFLKTATESWKTKPQYLILAGDASLDPRNYLGFGDFDFVPTRILPTASLKTASDDWFSDFDNTGLAKIATGRLPARTEADMQLMVSKIVNYVKTAPTGWTSQALMVADRDDPTLSFSQAAQSVQKLLPASIRTTDVFATALGVPAAKQDLIAGINRGQLLVNYNGHGSVEVWSGSDLFDDTAASSLMNGSKLPFFAIMNCLNGFFQDVYTQSLAEALMLAPDGGAVAVWASSGLTQPDPQFAMNRRFVQRLFSQPAPAIGDAVLSAKSSITDQDVRKTFILFGDPAMRLQTTAIAGGKK